MMTIYFSECICYQLNTIELNELNYKYVIPLFSRLKKKTQQNVFIELHIMFT